MTVHTTSVQRAILVGQLVTIVPMALIIYIPGFALGFVGRGNFLESQMQSGIQKIMLQFILIEAVFVLIAILYRRYALGRWKEWAFANVPDQEALREMAIKKRLMKQTDAVPFNPLKWNSIQPIRKSSSTPENIHTNHFSTPPGSVDLNTGATPNAKSFNHINAETRSGESVVIRKSKQYLEKRLIIFSFVALLGVFMILSGAFFFAIFALVLGVYGISSIYESRKHDRKYIQLNGQGIQINNIGNFIKIRQGKYTSAGILFAHWSNIREISFSDGCLRIHCDPFCDENGATLRIDPQQAFSVLDCDMDANQIEQIICDYQRKYAR